MTPNYCPFCGAFVQPGTRFCPGCGQTLQSVPPMSATPSPNYGPNAQTQYSADPPGKGKAITSLVLGLIAIFIIIPIVSGIGLWLGIKAKGELESAGQKSGMATWGIVLNSIALVWSVIFILAMLAG